MIKHVYNFFLIRLFVVSALTFSSSIMTMEIDLFREYRTVTTNQIAKLLGLQPRTIRKLCQKWVDEKFIVVVDPSRKGRKYQLAPEYEVLLKT